MLLLLKAEPQVSSQENTIGQEDVCAYCVRLPCAPTARAWEAPKPAFLWRRRVSAQGKRLPP